MVLCIKIPVPIPSPKVPKSLSFVGLSFPTQWEAQFSLQPGKEYLPLSVMKSRRVHFEALSGPVQDADRSIILIVLLRQGHVAFRPRTHLQD